MPDTPDKGAAQADDTGGKTATATQGDPGSAPGPDEIEALKQQLEAQKSEAQKLKDRYSHAERKIREQGQELGRFRQHFASSDTGQPDYGRDTSTDTQELTAADRALARASWSMLAEEIDGTPKEKRELREKIEAFLSDDPKAHEFIRQDPYHTYRAVIEHWEGDKVRSENEELRKKLAKYEGQKDTLAASAVVSGSGSAEMPKNLTPKEFRELPRDKQREILKGLGMYRP